MKTDSSHGGAPAGCCTLLHHTRNLPGLWFAIVIVLSLLAAGTLFAQSNAGIVEGRVQNAFSGDYLNNARIAIAGTNQVVFSDSAGFYRIGNLPAGQQTLRVSYTGLEEQEITVNVMSGGVVRQDVSLTSTYRYVDSQTVKLDPFTVAATREMDAASLAINEQRFAPNIKNVIAADAFGDVSEGNVGEFIKRLPGVSINFAAGDAYSVSLRGFSPEFTPITVDGNDVPSASFSAGSISRGSNFEQLSMSNVARVEVVKSPIPSMSADSLGGSVNLITKSAFERSKPELTVRGTLQFTESDYSWKKTAQPGGKETRKLRPGYELSYINPVNNRFGFALSSMLSDQFGKLTVPTSTFEFNPAQGGGEETPYLRSFVIREDPRETERQSYAAKVDARPFDALTLSVGYRHNIFDLFTAPTRLSFNTGNNPASFGSDFTQGRAGAGSAVHQQLYTRKFGKTDQYSASAKYEKDAWRADVSGSYARSWNKYGDTEFGFMRRATTRLASASTLRFDRFSNFNAPRIEALDANGQVIDWRQLDNYQILSVGPGDANSSTDTISSGNINLRRGVVVGRNFGAIQAGGSLRKRVVDRERQERTWTYLGADGIPANLDNTAAPFVSAVDRVSTDFGVPSGIQWPDLFAINRHFEQHPEYFVLNEAAAHISQATNSERIKEEISAAYIQGEINLLENRVLVIGGVRFERTENTGLGLLRDRNAIYQRNASGELIRDGAGNPVPITTDPLERARLEYRPRGAQVGNSYSNYYPSLNVTFNATPDLLVRFSYARTLGRPNYNNVVPNFDVIEDMTRIVARNPKLKPWTGDNYEVSVEYYFKPSGVVSASVFRKEISDGFGSRTVILDDALLEQNGLDRAYLGWDLVSTFNIGEDVEITGFEFNYQQQLAFLPEWARGLSAFGNITVLDIDGPESSFGTMFDRTANWGVSYSRGRVGVGLNWNYQSSRSSPFGSLGTDGVTRQRSRLTLDLNSEFRLTSRLSCFFNARNLTNSLLYAERFSSRSPDYSHPFQATKYGVKMSVGVRGTF